MLTISMEQLMAMGIKTPLDVMDEFYTLAYWMTGSEMSADELVRFTYLRADHNTSTTELFKIFRTCYLNRSGADIAFGFIDPLRQRKGSPGRSLRHRFADMKLSVLLSEICGLKHQVISEIIGMPVETLNSRLSWGRTLLVKALLLVPPVERRVQLTGGILS